MLSAASCHTAAPSDVRHQFLKFSYGSWVCRCPGSSSQVQETGPSVCSCYSLEPRRESAGFPPTVDRGVVAGDVAHAAFGEQVVAALHLGHGPGERVGGPRSEERRGGKEGR